jgi:hypothetical protein
MVGKPLHLRSEELFHLRKTVEGAAAEVHGPAASGSHVTVKNPDSGENIDGL